MKKLLFLPLALLIGILAPAQNGGSKYQSGITRVRSLERAPWQPRFGMGIHSAKVGDAFERELSTTVRVRDRCYFDNAISTDYFDGVETFRRFTDQLNFRVNFLELERGCCMYHCFGAAGIRWQGDFYDEPEWWKPWDNDFRYAFALGVQCFVRDFPVGLSIEINSRGKRALGPIYMAGTLMYYFNK